MILTEMLLANAPVDPLDKILPWISTFVVAVIAAVFKVQADRAKAVRVEEPVPTVPTRKVPGAVTWDSFGPLVARMDRLERHLDDVRKEQSDQFKELLEAGSAREQRLLDKVDSMARALHSRIDEHIPRPRNPR
jgi:hypothetical protein